MLCTLYRQDIVNIIESIYYVSTSMLLIFSCMKHVQLRIYLIKGNSTSDCISFVKLWINSNRTELIIIGDCLRQPSALMAIRSKKNLGVLIDHDMSMSSHVPELGKNLYFQIQYKRLLAFSTF